MIDLYEGRDKLGKKKTSGKPVKKKNDSYMVFARKWRPQTFEEVVGQESVKKQLQNALSEKRIANAYLFSGPRGVGKTSVARILAKALNCEKGITPNPCNKCEQCVSITQGSSMDVIEIDGASYTGIDSIRDLQEGISRASFSARKKVYIIDEVHMLSISAFNALLKTLEEPPDFVVFIFATTQIEKIPETIISRCQISHFERIATKDIIERLKLILSKEKGIKADPKEKKAILEAIATSSEGGMRDAEVTLDQLISLSGGRLKFEHVSQLLGLVEFDLLFGTIKDLTEKNISSLLARTEKLVTRGRDLERFVKTFQGFLRDLLILKAGANTLMKDYSDQRIQEMKTILESLTMPFLLNIMNNFFMLEERMKTSGHLRFLLEFVFIKLCVIQSDVDIDSIMQSLEQFEKTAGAPVKKNPVYDASPPAPAPVMNDLFKDSRKSPKTPKAPPPPPKPLAKENLIDSTELWQRFKAEVVQRKHVLEDVLERCPSHEFQNNTLFISTTAGYDEKFLATPDSVKIMEGVLSGLVGTPCNIRLKIEIPQTSPGKTPTSQRAMYQEPEETEEDDSFDDKQEISETDMVPGSTKTTQKPKPKAHEINVEDYRHLFQDNSAQKKIVLELLKNNPDIKTSVDLIEKIFQAKLTKFDGKNIS